MIRHIVQSKRQLALPLAQAFAAQRIRKAPTWHKESGDVCLPPMAAMGRSKSLALPMALLVLALVMILPLLGREEKSGDVVSGGCK